MHKQAIMKKTFLKFQVLKKVSKNGSFIKTITTPTIFLHYTKSSVNANLIYANLPKSKDSSWFNNIPEKHIKNMGFETPHL